MIELIPKSYLNESCFLSLNTDDKKYSMVLKLAQEDLANVLGREFYNQIETQYDTDTLSTDNDTLYETYIKDFLAWQTYFHYLKFANVEATPTGIRSFTDENSTIAQDVQMYSLEKNVKARAVMYRHGIINHINEQKFLDSTKFPLFKSRCKSVMSFGITSIGKTKDALIKVNKTIDSNE